MHAAGKEFKAPALIAIPKVFAASLLLLIPLLLFLVLSRAVRRKEGERRRMMLQRAATSAYTWWWSSHIRTKQSKWLENSLQDMEMMITSMLKIIEEDADTFAKRAEMYYRKRPELTDLVQEAYKAFRALAERYDHLSGALQKANNTIATVFPDQHFGMEDDDDDDDGSATRKADQIPAQHGDPYTSARALRGQSNMKRKKKKMRSCSVAKAEEEIDKLQKDILVLQTEKEFIKCSYESGIAKFWEKHKIITEMQEKLSTLQDEFCDEVVIEDDEARVLMTVTAVKSCVQRLIDLYEKRIKCMEDVRLHSQRIKDAKEKLRANRMECRLTQLESLVDPSSLYDSAQLGIDQSMVEELSNLKQQKLGLELVSEKIKKNFQMNPDMSVLDIADEIDEHVSRITALDTAVSSQIAQVEILRLEVDEFYEKLQSLEDERLDLSHELAESCDKLKLAEEELQKVQNLDKAVQDESCSIQKQFAEACSGLSVLSQKLTFPEDTQEMVAADSIVEATEFLMEDKKLTKTACEAAEETAAPTIEENTTFDTNQSLDKMGKESLEIQEQHDEVGGSVLLQEDSLFCLQMDQGEKENHNEEQGFIVTCEASQELQSSSYKHDHPSKHADCSGDASLLNWQESPDDDLDDREKILLAEYTSILQSHEELKKRLMESDKKYQNQLFQTTSKMRDLKNSIVMKDEEIRSLRQQLHFLAASWAENPDVHMAEPEVQEFTVGRSGKASRSSSFVSMTSEALGSELSLEPNTKQAENIEDRVSNVSKLLQLKSMKVRQGEAISSVTAIEDKFRTDIDQLLEDNLGLWLRFKSSFEEMQKHGKEFQELEAKVTMLVDKKDAHMTSSGENFLKGGARKVHQQLKVLWSNLTTWLEENSFMNEELHNRFSSLSIIEEEILRVAKEEGEGVHFTAYQALKFQGEIVNMRQENNIVAGELRAGMDHVRSLQAMVSNLLEKLDKKFELSSSRYILGGDYIYTSFKSNIPLSAFLFGTRPKKHLFFSCMNPAYQRQFSDLAARHR